MGASSIEFRFRVLIFTVIISLGFWSPWIEAWGIGRRISLLEWLALELSRTGLVRFTVSVPVVIVIGSLIAAIGAVLRLWGTAYLGSFTVNNAQMKADSVMAGGPYRHVRNPLYLGTWFVIGAMSFLQPATGAFFTMLLITIFEFRLILGEENFLAVQLGAPYLAYKRAVPRLVPRIYSNLPTTGRAAHWKTSFLSEINPIGIFVILAGLTWTYNNTLLVKAVLISFGLSLVVRALIPQQPPEAVA